MIDYKIKSIQLSSQGITADVAIYNGSVTTENELVNGVSTPVTRYRRSAKVVDRTISLNAQQVTGLFEKWLNKKILEEAAQRGTTVITDQRGTSV